MRADAPDQAGAGVASPAKCVHHRLEVRAGEDIGKAINERRDAAGRVRYQVRVRRGGGLQTATLPTLRAALTWQAQALEAADGLSEQPEPPRPVRPEPLARAATVEEAARRLCRGMVDGTVRARDGHPYKPSVARTYEEALRLLVVPRIGAAPVGSLRRGDVQRLVDEIAAVCSPSHARKALTALRVALRLAERYGEADQNPCDGVRAPAGDVEARPARVLSAAEAVELVGAAERDDARFGRSFAAPLVGLALSTGLRLGELLALPWGSDGLDLEAGVARVRRSLDRHHGEGGYQFVPPKSRASRREVPLPPADVARLRRHRLATGRPAGGELVFAGEQGEPVAPHGLPRAAWRRLIAGTAGTPPLVSLAAPLPRFHDLRHTYATHMLAAGRSVHAVAELLGHGDATLVLARYGHAMPGEVASAGDALEAWRIGTGMEHGGQRGN